ncbi:uncharacterized protein LOC114251315 [Bombyx mandarina]|uniref:Uncharacterized protein LOC114251315 n=1 Tax=Bombyx mandarina TaxID=7092 RepID=A0A6J2KH22_BOMMA|nr:uncharacterized protein LOC114251315 [Bombyx mandarina]
MCCIFTCCGWMIDLFQRLWTFTMSCCISSAVGCAFLTASVSGIALGYNYSLAEYIDLKETNVSVYIKRGVFDDEIADDMEWRRSGHMPIAGHIREDNLMTGSPEEENPQASKSGRRLDDSIFESDDQNKFEGSLMRLTAKAPAFSTTTKPATSDLEMAEIMSKYQLGSVDQLKAIQGLINMRKSGDARDTTAKGAVKTTFGYDERYLPHFPAFPDPMMSGRRIMPSNININVDKADSSLRKAVPEASINEPDKWGRRKAFPGAINDVAYDYLDKSPKYPPPVTPKPGPVRPTKLRASSAIFRPTHTQKVIESSPKMDYAISKEVDRDLEEFKEKLMLDKFENPNLKSDVLKMPKEEFIKAEDDYEADIKGLPVRKKRNVSDIKKYIKPASSESNVVKKDKNIAFSIINNNIFNLASRIAEKSATAQMKTQNARTKSKLLLKLQS